ncbi:MAG: hypothetical protein XD60_1493 [Acetothermia bacterium 64_32]|nr:MAG: hypothetical protein XD60_1493 [Acetothermia bacterium 64_32]
MIFRVDGFHYAFHLLFEEAIVHFFTLFHPRFYPRHVNSQARAPSAPRGPAEVAPATATQP